MNLRESELVREAIDGIAQVFEQHEGGVFNATALKELDHLAYTVRICTTDAVCREKLGFIQDQAAVYFTDRRLKNHRKEKMPGVEFLRSEIKKAVVSLYARFVQIRSKAAS
jgi:hypothetical protein